MTSEPITDDLKGREPSGSEIELVEAIRQARAAKTASDAFYEWFLAHKFTPRGLTLMIDDYRAKLKADARAR